MEGVFFSGLFYRLVWLCSVVCDMPALLWRGGCVALDRRCCGVVVLPGTTCIARASPCTRALSIRATVAAEARWGVLLPCIVSH